MGYNNTLEAAQNTLDELMNTCLRTACAGADPIKHLNWGDKRVSGSLIYFESFRIDGVTPME
eukprot:9381473-Pyramimonas_sp.AAC.1